jgi:hypothetical protein
LSDQFKEDEMGGACGMHWTQDKYIQILVWKSEGKIPFGRPTCRYDYNMKTDLKEIGWEGTALIHLAQDRNKWSAVLNMVRNL